MHAVPCRFVAEVRAKRGPREFTDNRTGEIREAPAEIDVERVDYDPETGDEQAYSITVRLGDAVETDFTFGDVSRGDKLVFSGLFRCWAKNGRLSFMYVPYALSADDTAVKLLADSEPLTAAG